MARHEQAILDNPHGYYVDLSQKLWQLKQDMMARHAGGGQ